MQGVITPNELRIGNLIDQNLYDQVDELPARFISQRDVIVEGLNVALPYESLVAVPISEDWLVRAGFKKDDYGNMWKDHVTGYFEVARYDKLWFPVIASYGELSSEPEQRVGLPCMAYVHQLQNTYFYAVGEELTFSS